MAKAEYPKYLYNEKGEAILVQNKEEHKALGGDLKESPADFKKKGK